LSRVEFRDFVGLDILDRMKDADLFIAERLIEGAQTETADGITFPLSDCICAQDKETPTAGANCRACLKLRVHGQIL
jgi:hypothetical protein